MAAMEENTASKMMVKISMGIEGAGAGGGPAPAQTPVPALALADVGAGAGTGVGVGAGAGIGGASSLLALPPLHASPMPPASREMSAHWLRVEKMPSIESPLAVSKKHEQSCCRGAPALMSVGVACVNSPRDIIS